MTIPVHYPLVRARKVVAWFGRSAPDDERIALVNRDFVVESCTDENLQDPSYLAVLAAVVFTQDTEKPNQIGRPLEMHAQRLLNYDCRIILRPASKETPPGSKNVTKFISVITGVINTLELPTSLPELEAKKLNDWQPTGEGDPPFPRAHVFDTEIPCDDIANFITVHPPGNPPQNPLDLIIEVEDKDGNPINFDGKYPPDVSSNGNFPSGKKNKNNLNPGSELLLRRAFWDCKKVHLVAMADGLSGVPVFRAFPELALGQAGEGSRGTRPYFVKIGDRREIFEEYKKYIDLVRPYIPFHLGPHLVLERCCLGADQGVIVGDLVDESESLRSCASDGRAALAIACLFNRTLHGWHSRFTRDTRSLVDIQDGRNKDYFPSGIPKDRALRVAELGAKKTLGELRELFNCCSELTPVLTAQIHGDLHGANVLVRGSDAIVIDFLSQYKGPLVYDAACLEAGLLVDGFLNDNRIPSDWLKSILPLYDQDSLFGISAHIHPKDPSAWFYACVRQIRLHARQMQFCEGQYAAALSAILLKKSCKDREFSYKHQASHRAGAYVLAEHVLLRHFGSMLATKKLNSEIEP